MHNLHAWCIIMNDCLHCIACSYAAITPKPWPSTSGGRLPRTTGQGSCEEKVYVYSAKKQEFEAVDIPLSCRC